MIKKKTRSKSKNSNATKKAKKRRPRKPIDPEKVRQELAGIVKARAKKITSAVANKACNGDLAPAKFLFEMAHIFPEAPVVEEKTSTEEDSLAKTLLDGLGIPQEPVIHDLYERGEDVVIIPPRSEEAVEEVKKEEAALVGAE